MRRLIPITHYRTNPAISPICTATWFPGAQCQVCSSLSFTQDPHPKAAAKRTFVGVPHGSAVAVAPKFFGYPDGVQSFRRPTRRTWEAASIDLFQLFEISPTRTVVLARSELFERRVRPIEATRCLCHKSRQLRLTQVSDRMLAIAVRLPAGREAMSLSA